MLIRSQEKESLVCFGKGMALSIENIDFKGISIIAYINSSEDGLYMGSFRSFEYAKYVIDAIYESICDGDGTYEIPSDEQVDNLIHGPERRAQQAAQNRKAQKEREEMRNKAYWEFRKILTPRLASALSKAGYFSVEDVRNASIEELLTKRNIGEGSIKELKEAGIIGG